MCELDALKTGGEVQLALVGVRSSVSSADWIEFRGTFDFQTLGQLVAAFFEIYFVNSPDRPRYRRGNVSIQFNFRQGSKRCESFNNCLVFAGLLKVFTSYTFFVSFKQLTRRGKPDFFYSNESVIKRVISFKEIDHK